jgi:integrase
MPGQLVKRGETWTVRVFVGRDPETGRRSYVNRTVRGTKKEAQAVLTGLLRQRDLRDLVVASTRLLVSEYLEEWKEKALRARVRPRTFDDYERLLTRYVIPVIGQRRLSSLSPLDVQGVISRLVGRGLSPRTVRYCHTVLSNALRQAVRWRYLRANPAQDVELPKIQRREMRAMTEDEAQRFLAAASGSDHAALFAVLLGTGLRPGEAVALKWGDLDAAGGRIIVRRAASPAKGGPRLDAPKTPRARRTVDLPETLTKMLLARRGEAADDDFMFPSRAGTPIDVRNLARAHFKPILQRAGLPAEIRLYDLRHTHATLLLLAGVNPKIVSERLGHASVMLTLDVYSHVLPGMQAESARQLDSMLFRGAVGQRARTAN